MKDLSFETKSLLEEIAQKNNQKTADQFTTSQISVSNLTSGIEFLYEKIRNALEYREEHLWLKDAVLRILKRRFFEILAKEKIGRELVEELIRGHYLKNDSFPENKTDEIDEILKKYRQVAEIFEKKFNLEEKQNNKYEEWFLGITALEIVELISENKLDRSFINYFWNVTKKSTTTSPEISGEEFDQQLYLSVFRNFLKADELMEQYEIFRLKYEEWFENPKDLIDKFGAELPELKKELQKSLGYGFRKDLDQVMKRRSLFIFMLQDMISQEKEGAERILNDPELLENKLKEIYDSHYQKGREKLQTSTIRAIIFIILTKMILLFAIEIPFQIWREGRINYLILGINTLIPPIILIISSLIIKMPGEEQNFLKIVSEFQKMIRYGQEMPPLDIVRNKQQRSWPTKLILWSIYGLNVFFTGWILNKFFNFFNFNVVDSAIFILFLSLISFFAIRLRKTANELAAVEERDHLVTIIVEFFFFPIIEIGKIISQGISSLNLTAFIFDFLIETPFKTMIKILEEWFAFIRERRQNL
ncbi:MAG: hypothetical protein A2418_01880 [Candidatus Brennerbacteria bacterium RIFOXYC1_FULL_41_11]|nr:MAG: hypothetical protein UU61_C0001G0015 [Parcubacteria group bacterium GW2011_GWB1_41_4]OGY39900.1 MAG: hypothetical protein A2418_01880 [Candidatus Brennerbacteria bacterium RIFOXYC1_FULL_41_11]